MAELIYTTDTEVCCAWGEPEGHPGPCAIICDMCDGDSRCPDCGGEDDLGCHECGGTGSCAWCHDGLVTDDAS